MFATNCNNSIMFTRCDVNLILIFYTATLNGNIWSGLNVDITREVYVNDIIIKL